MRCLPLDYPLNRLLKEHMDDEHTFVFNEHIEDLREDERSSVRLLPSWKAGDFTGGGTGDFIRCLGSIDLRRWRR